MGKIGSPPACKTGLWRIHGVQFECLKVVLFICMSLVPRTEAPAFANASLRVFISLVTSM